ncbi:MAG: PQQ-dependent sugar dehydrogenase [Steroidobacteraceae bacterium]
MHRSRDPAAIVAIALTAASLPVSAQAPKSPTPKPIDAPIRAVTVARGLQHPWGLEFLPDGRLIVTERPGRLRIAAKDGTLSQPLGGVPEVAASGQGGLLDVALGPSFEKDRLVYLSFAEPGDGGAGTAVARGRLGSKGLEGTQVIWRQTPKVDGGNHFGSRLAFARDGTLFVTTGDRFTHREKVQDLSTTVGKIVRINADGSMPKDNPFVGRDGARPEIWSFGHRSIQAAAIHPDTGDLWTIEHGARGGDELNRVLPGRNYGWPVITYGIDYSGLRIGEGTSKPGMEQPVYYWDPVIAPSGALFYTGGAYGDWRGSLFVGSMVPGLLVRLELKDGRVTREERTLASLGERIRDVRQGPDELLYLITDSANGRVLRIEPTLSAAREE